MPEAEIREVDKKSAFMHPGKFYPKPKIVLKDTPVTEEIQEKFDKLLNEYEDIMSNINRLILGSQPWRKYL